MATPLFLQCFSVFSSAFLLPLLLCFGLQPAITCTVSLNLTFSVCIWVQTFMLRVWTMAEHNITDRYTDSTVTIQSRLLNISFNKPSSSWISGLQWCQRGHSKLRYSREVQIVEEVQLAYSSWVSGGGQLREKVGCGGFRPYLDYTNQKGCPLSLYIRIT